MEMITNPAKTLAKIEGMNGADVKKYEKLCQKALKTAKDDVCVVKMKTGDKYITTDALCQVLDALDYRYNVLTQNWDKIHGLFEDEPKTAPNVKKVLHKNVEKPIDKPKKINYINNTNETKTTKKEGKTMNKNEITNLTNTIKIAPNALKNIMAAQKKNKTDIAARYWGGWGKVVRGMNAAYRDYDKYQNLETEWLELRSRLGGMKSSKYHFCWGLINKNRVGVKQEPNATLRFIKNVKIRIAMANDVLANKYTKSQIDAYMNGLSQNYKIKYGLV